ncbi:MAG: hypothetical protein PHO89_05460 [Methylacidiphilaceae bacterium]|nr:hypothetical protein [Candidatus Methylacidiphilaceae bacterium]
MESLAPRLIGVGRLGEDKPAAEGGRLVVGSAGRTSGRVPVRLLGTQRLLRNRGDGSREDRWLLGLAFFRQGSGYGWGRGTSSTSSTDEELDEDGWESGAIAGKGLPGTPGRTRQANPA